MANELRYRASIKDDVSGPLERIKDKFGQIQKAGAKPFIQGAAIGAGVVAFNALGNAISATTQWLGESIGKAREEQAGIAKLEQSLKANAKGYDGNRDAIERVITSREKLAFSDGEQRDSLAELIAITKDANKALELNRVAMDLARLKGLDLASASTIVGKVYGGNIGILTRYGIQLQKGVTSTEALAKVQEMAAGQAEVFADTTEGSMQSAQIAIENLQEEIGTELLPIIKEVALVVRDDVVPAFKEAIGIIKESGLTFEMLGSGIESVGYGKIVKTITDISDAVRRWKGENTTATEQAVIAWGHMSGQVGGAAADTGDAIEGIGESAEDAATRVEDALVDMVNAAKATRRKLETLGQDAADALFDPLIAKADLAATRREIAETKAIITSKKSTKEQVRDAKERLTELEKTAFELQVELLGWGKMNAKEQKKFLASLEREWGQATGEAKDDIAALIAYIKRIPRAVTITMTTRQRSESNTDDHRAAGGVVLPHKTYLVNEKQREYLSMGSQSGIISPNAVGGSGGGGGSIVINVSTPALTPGGAQALADAIAPAITRWQQQRGI